MQSTSERTVFFIHSLTHSFLFTCIFFYFPQSIVKNYNNLTNDLLMQTLLLFQKKGLLLLMEVTLII